MQLAVNMSGITKTFPGVKALDNLYFELAKSEVHVVLGENGAGKSTLMKILSGIYTPSSGSIEVFGKTYLELNPKLSIELGISTIYQELSVIDELSIWENMFVGTLQKKKILNFFPVLDKESMRERASQALKNLGLVIDINKTVGELSISEKQLVEIAKALVFESKIIILDEPTSSLTISEVEKLFKVLRELRDKGLSLIYISHKLDEIKKIGDRVTVLKDGTYVGTKQVADVSTEQMISMMVGREISNLYSKKEKSTEQNKNVFFKVENLTRKDKRVSNISFELYQGEILGFAGLIGSGRTELMEAIFQASPTTTGRMWLKGTELTHKNPHQAINSRITLITENRRKNGFFHNFSIWKNIGIGLETLNTTYGGIFGLVNDKRSKLVAEEKKRALNIKCTSINQSIIDLSGGNQQKVIIGKWLACEPELMIFDEPTRGIDVGAKTEIYTIIRNLADQGKGIILVSSELPELLSVCDRIVVFNSGKITEIMPIHEATEERIILSATK